MSAHYNCTRGDRGQFITRTQEIMNRIREQAERESHYENKTAELSVLIAMSGTVFDADGMWREIVEPETTWEAAYHKLAKTAVEQGILKPCDFSFSRVASSGFPSKLIWIRFCSLFSTIRPLLIVHSDAGVAWLRPISSTLPFRRRISALLFVRA